MCQRLTFAVLFQREGDQRGRRGLGSHFVSTFHPQQAQIESFPPWMELEAMRGACSPRARAGADALQAPGWGRKEQGWCLEAGVPERGENKSAWAGGC